MLGWPILITIIPLDQKGCSAILLSLEVTLPDLGKDRWGSGLATGMARRSEAEEALPECFLF